MTNDFDFQAVAASAVILLLPIISTALSVGGAWFIGRRAVQRTRALRDETERFRDEIRSMLRDASEDDTAEFRRVGGLPGQRAGNFPRHRVEGPVTRQWPGDDPDERNLSHASPVRTKTRKAGTP